MISAVCWIPPGKAKAVPEKYTPTEAELEAIKGSKKKGKGEQDEEVMEDTDNNNNNNKSNKTTDVAKLYGFDNYDDEAGDDMAGVEGDPMVQIESDDEEDLDDVIIRPTDSLLLAIEASDENDLSHLDIYIYEEHNSNLYVHHDVFLESFPLCVAWQDYLPRSASDTAPVNLAAVGSFDPAIQIWDLDVLDPVYPLAILGGTERIGKTKKRKFLAGSHTDAVMGIDWNVNKRNLLASSSADKSVKIWDLETCACVQTYTQHTDKVESVQWNPQEASIVVCGSYDKTVTIMDVRSSASETSLRWSVPADVESIRWNPLSPQHFFVSCENGSVMLYDAMKGGNSAPVWTLDAHSKSTSAISINSAVPIFATGSMDKTVKIWSYSGNKPTLLHEQNAGQHVFSLSFYNYNAPYLLAAGGDKSTLRVLNTLNYEQVAPVFGREVVVPTEDQDEDGMEQDDKPKAKANKKNINSKNKFK